MIGSAHPDQTISAWLFYVIAMLYDFLTLSVSTHLLLKLRDYSASSNSARLLKILLYDGLGYFVVLTATNLTNVVIYRGVGGAIQTSGASMEYAVIWIMSQRILIHLREERAKQASIVLSTPRANIPGSFHKLPGRNRQNDNSTIEIGNNSNKYDSALSDYSVGVRIERSIIRDTHLKPLDEESEIKADRDLYPPPISVHVWDEIKQSEV